MHNKILDWVLVNYGQEVMKPGLDRIRMVVENLIPAFKNSKIVIIAGTNGKGETTLRLSGLLKNKIHYVWTSPHIERITERFRNHLGEIPPQELQNLIQNCHQQVKEMGVQLSFYEFLFFVFCKWASLSPPEFLLLEVGMGGRLDAVNIFDAHLVLLPSISRDHQEFLGRRYEQILYEKLGTLREGTQLIHFLQNDYLIERAEKFALEKGSSILPLVTKISIPEYDFSLRNHVLAGAAYCCLTHQEFVPVQWREAQNGLENRGEVIKSEHSWVFYGSHNVDGLRKLIQFLLLEAYNFKGPPFDVVLVAFSKRNPQDLKVMMRMLKKANLGQVVLTTFEHPKAASAQEVEALAKEEGLDFVKSIDSYVHGKNKGQKFLVTGSYYFLWHIKYRFCHQQSSINSW